MFNGGWWNMFETYGTVELYLLYKLIEKQARDNAGNEDGGTHSEFSKFE